VRDSVPLPHRDRRHILTQAMSPIFAIKRASIPYGRKHPNGLVLHARHTATTHLLESNVSPKTVPEWMGWSDKAFVLYYSHATKQSREQAGGSLERLAGGNTA
jgi:integrase